MNPSERAAPETTVRLDLNNPVFQRDLFGLQYAERHVARETLAKLYRLNWNQVYRDKGLRWEKITSLKPPSGIDALYSLRITQAPRRGVARLSAVHQSASNRHPLLLPAGTLYSAKPRRWILYESILPYILWIVFYVICTFFAYKFIPIVPVWKSIRCNHVFLGKEQFLSIFSGKAFQCQKCGGFFVYSREWISIVTIVEFLAFFVTVMLSVSHRSFYPYLLYVVFFALCSYLSYKFVPIRPIE
jgi:hypothetical protein